MHTPDQQQSDCLRQSEEQYRALFESMQEGVIYFSGPREIERMNSAAHHILGRSLAEVRQRYAKAALWTLVDEHGLRLNPQTDSIARCFATGQAETGALFTTFNPQSGRDLWLVANVTPQFKEYGVTPYQVIVTFNDITDQMRTRHGRLFRLWLLENSHRWTMAELLRQTLDKIGEHTGSPIGFYHFVDEAQGTLSLQMWSSATQERFCRIGGKSGATYAFDKAGVWLDALRQRTTVVHNDYASLPQRKGMPEGHATVVRELVTPIVRDGTIVAILGVGNKERDYTEEDAALVQHFADLS